MNIICAKCIKGAKTGVQNSFKFEFSYTHGNESDPRDIRAKRIYHGLHYENLHPLHGHQIYAYKNDKKCIMSD